MKFQPNNFEKVIFDMDGVITSEHIYWDTAALTVYELLYSHKRFGVMDIDRAWCRENYKELHGVIFCDDKTIRAVKNLGVNTNWDLAYIVFCVSKYIDPEGVSLDEWHFESVRMFIENITVNAPEVYDLVGKLGAMALGQEIDYFKRGHGEVWDSLIDSFQAWFHGSDGVDGLNLKEEPLLPIDDIKEVLHSLKESGLKLGIGTGRPRDEIIFPLNEWNLIEYFEPDMIATYDEVSIAEKSLKLDTPISKPNPFVFLKSAYGSEFSDSEILDKDFANELCERIVVIGDAPSDLLAAKSAKFKFVGVLTGVDRVSAEKYFFSMNADYIMEDMTGLIAKNN